MATINSTVWSSCQEYLEKISPEGPQVICLQEHHLDGEQMVEAQRWLRAHGWTSMWAAADRTHLGTSGGVALLARSHLGLCSVPGRANAVLWPARSVVGFLPNFCGRGLVLISTYLHTAVGWDSVNIDMVRSIAHFVSDLACSWIWGGDMNMAPALFARGGPEMSDPAEDRENWIARMNAVMVAPRQATCMSSAEGSTIDYFVMATGLAHNLVEVRVNDGATLAPHRPVELVLDRVRRSLRTRVRVKPKPFPALPPGCARKPDNWSRARTATASASSASDLREAWAAILKMIELELLARFDVVEDQEDYVGRAEGPRYKEVVLKPQSCQVDVSSHRLDDVGQAWLKLRRWTVQLVRLLNGVRSSLNSENLEVKDKLGRLLGQVLDLRRKVAGSKALRVADSPLTFNLFRDDFPYYWRKLAVMIYKEADKQAERCRRAGLHRWTKWAKEVMLAPGASAAHRYTKAVHYQQAVNAVVDVDGRLAADPVLLVSDALAEWKKVWEHHKGNDSVIPYIDGLEELPIISPDMIDEAIKKFAGSTAVGCDDLHPKLLLQVSTPGKWAIGALFRRCEQLQCWPTDSMMHLLMAAVPKPTGGHRLIGILPTLLRVWGRVRRPLADQWEAATPHPACWGCKGKATSEAAYTLLYKGETATLQGGGSATVLLDLWKAYETVLPGILLREGLASGFPPTLLVMAIKLYRIPRVLKLLGALSLPYFSKQGIIAGCSLATSLLRALLYRSLVRISAQYDVISFTLVVDDLSLQWAGPKQRFHLAAKLIQAVAAVFDALIKLCMVAQYSKCGYVVTSRRLRGILTALFADSEFPIDAKGWMRNLGHELPGAARGKRRQEQARLQEGLARRLRMGKFARAVGSQISRVLAAGLHPSWLHGASSMGVAPKVLDKQRSLVAAVFKIPPSQSLSAALLLQPLRVDPIFLATIPLLMAFATRLWDGRLQLEELSLSFEAILKKDEATSGMRWASCLGPMQAMWLTLRRIGWRWSSPRQFTTDEGTVIDLMALAPAMLKKRIEEGLRRWQVKRATAKLSTAGSTDYGLLRAVMFGKFAGITGISDEAARGALRKLSIGGLWTRQQLCAIGRATSELCAHCGTHPDSPGLRWWRCVGTRAPRQGHPEAAALAEAVSEVVLEGQLFSNAQPLLYEFDDEFCYGQEIFEEGCTTSLFQGHVFLDGSGFMPTEDRLRRCGWAVVLLNDRWDLERALYGPLPQGPQTVPHSEHYALAMALDYIVGDTVIYTDCQSVMDYDALGVAAGSSKKLYAGLWRRILARRAVLSGQGISITLVKVRAHLDPDLMEQGSDLQFRTVGNAIADKWAKKGALNHVLSDYALESFLKHREQNLQVIAAVVSLWIFTMNDGTWVDSDDALLDPTPALQPAPAAAGPRLVVVHHTMVQREWGEQCLACRRWARPGPHLDRLLGLACVPLAPAFFPPEGAEPEAGAGRVHTSHNIQMHRSGVVWCTWCGSYADRSLRNLGDVCFPFPTRFGRSVLRSLARGLHPRTGMPLGSSAGPGARSQS